MNLYEYFTAQIKKELAFDVERVEFHPPATIVFWTDGTKTVSKCSKCLKWRNLDGTHSCGPECHSFEPHVGLAVACARKAVPKYTELAAKWTGESNE